MITIEDDLHAEMSAPFADFEAAVAELARRATVPWDQPPNAAPCMSSRTCGRAYHIVEYDDARSPWERLRDVPVLNVSADGVEWVDGYEQAWRCASPKAG